MKKLLLLTALIAWFGSQNAQCQEKFSRLSPNKILPVFFDSQEMKGDKIFWKPNFEDALEIGQSGKFETELDTVFYFQAEGKSYAVAVFITDTKNFNAPENSLFIGFALLERVGSDWKTKALRKLYTASNGTSKGEIRFHTIGDAANNPLYGIELRSDETGGRIRSAYGSLVLVSTSNAWLPSFATVFSTEIYLLHSDEEGPAFDGIITFEANTNMVITDKNNPNYKQVYRFNGKEYKEIK